MRKKDVERLYDGLYRIYWKEKGGGGENHFFLLVKYI